MQPYASLSRPLFVATRPDHVPCVAGAFWSVDGAVPGAARVLDHHATGEPVNLDVLPGHVGPGELDAIGTTQADTDAVLSAVVLLVGGLATLDAATRDVFRAACLRCDHLVATPGASPRTQSRGDRLHAWITARLRADPSPRHTTAFARLTRHLARRVLDGRPLPGARPPRRLPAPLAARVSRRGPALVADLRGAATPALDIRQLYARAPDATVGLFIEDHPTGGTRYTLGRNPVCPRAPDDLRPALAALARAEHAHGPPCRAPEPTPDAENWGGRAAVIGSPWNYGSRLRIDDILTALP